MHILFCNDGPIRVDEEGNYYGCALNDEFFKKYFQLGEKLTVCIRILKIEDDKEKSKYSKITLPNIRFVEMPNLSSLKGLTKHKSAKNILELEIKKADLVVARVPSLIANIAVKIAKKQNVACMSDVVGCPWDSLFNHSILGRLMAGPQFFAQRKTVKKSDYVIYVTQKFLQDRYPSVKKSIGLSDVLLESITDSILEKRLAHIKYHSGKIIIGTTAAINVKYKGQDNVIRALGRLKEKGITNFEYQLVGGGDPSYLQKIAKICNVEDQLKIIGSLPHDKVFDWLDSIDIYTQPSFQEGLSRGLIEAMSRGLPCIASDVGGNPELIEKAWIFKRKKEPIEGIMNLLIKIDKQVMSKMATRNFNESKKYQQVILDKKRGEFYEQIKDELSSSYRI